MFLQKADHHTWVVLRNQFQHLLWFGWKKFKILHLHHPRSRTSNSPSTSIDNIMATQTQVVGSLGTITSTAGQARRRAKPACFGLYYYDFGKSLFVWKVTIPGEGPLVMNSKVRELRMTSLGCLGDAGKVYGIRLATRTISNKCTKENSLTQ